MLTFHPKYITDDKGKKISVVLPVDEFKSIVEELEELEEIRLYDDVKASSEESLPIDEAFNIIEEERNTQK